ncbi:MAG TPA: hypothetical protein VH601_24525 [Bryobacteraceae bacterium]
MDSRQYIFIYPLKTNTDVPADFPREFRSRPFESGIFLPQDDSNWFTRAPARLLLLQERSFFIVPHPSSGLPPVEIKLDDLLQFETGCILLLGWMQFIARSEVHHLIYNTRGSRPLETFLGRLKRRWLENLPRLPKTTTEAYGDQLDIKFRNSVHFELEGEEASLMQYFQAPIRLEKKILLFRREDWRSGNVVFLTSMNRLVWITDQHRRRRELYASISRSVPSWLFENCTIEVNPEGLPHFVMLFRSGLEWRIPIFRALDEFSAFCDRLKQIVTPSALANNGPREAARSAARSN